MNYLEKFNSQKAYYKLGYTKSITFREMMLKKLLTAFRNYRQDFYVALKSDLNKHKFETFMSEIFQIEQSLRYTIKNLEKFSKDKKVKTPFYLPFSKSYIRSIPYGNALILNAYNYPLLLSLDPLIGAIAAGNTVMLGLSKKSVNTNKVLIKMLNTTFDSNYIFAFEVDRHVNNELLTYDFDKIFFTGSARVGKIILEKASKKLISTTLELGGKSPAVVSDSANIKNAANSIIYSKVLNAGQTCIASDYVLVDRKISENFINEVLKTLNKFYPDFSLFPKMIDSISYQRIINLINEDKKYLINDYKIIIDKLIVGLALLKVDISDVSNLASMKDEIFGPILPIIVYDNIEEAISLINSFDSALAFYPFASDRSLINYLLNSIEFGGATINDTLLHFSNHNLPFSGFKQSGMLSYHGKYSFDTFSYKQALMYKSNIFRYKFLFPPYKKYLRKL